MRQIGATPFCSEVILADMGIGPADYFELSVDELRVVAGYAAESAEAVLTIFEQANPDDPRPRAAASSWH